ncbi:hypothetical protein M514_26552 [Trichuris suis]|uniref:Uncharacterized protein n=1 Tax=Trichuris suis TaxID=68888 RepID=A0A085MVK8_9BILA|nr:hypothetical protein M514_26552 [Trichuris suis]
METALEFDKCLSVAVQTLEYERQQVILEVEVVLHFKVSWDGRSCDTGKNVVSTGETFMAISVFIDTVEPRL